MLQLEMVHGRDIEQDWLAPQTGQDNAVMGITVVGVVHRPGSLKEDSLQGLPMFPT